VNAMHFPELPAAHLRTGRPHPAIARLLSISLHRPPVAQDQPPCASLPKVVGEGFHDLQLAFHSSLREITTLELLQHQFANLGHRDLLATGTLSHAKRRAQPTKCSTAAHA
jgi:hypothetical protein